MASSVNAKEVKHFLKLSESTVYKLAANGEIPGYKIGVSWRFDFGEIERFIENKNADPPDEPLIGKLKSEIKKG